MSYSNWIMTILKWHVGWDDAGIPIKMFIGMFGLVPHPNLRFERVLL